MYLKDFYFADDITLIADTEMIIQTLIEGVHEASEYGIKISVPKSKAMVFSHEDQLQVKINLEGISLNQVHCFEYLEWH